MNFSIVYHQLSSNTPQPVAKWHTFSMKQSEKKKVTIKPRMVLLLVFFFLYENSVVECAGGGLPSRMPKDIFFIKTKKLKMLLLTFLLFVVNKAGRCIYCQHFKICPHTPHQIGVPKMKKPQKYQKSHQVFPFCSQI